MLGYMLSTGLTQMQGGGARTSLRASSEALFPAAQRNQGGGRWGTWAGE